MPDQCAMWGSTAGQLTRGKCLVGTPYNILTSPTQSNLIEKLTTIEPTNLPNSSIKFDFQTQSNPVKLNRMFYIIIQNKEYFFSDA